VKWTLEARALSRRKADGSSLLRAASIAVAPGDRIAVRDESGTGKTVFLRALAGLDPLESGELAWCGAVVMGAAFPAYRSQVVYVHQRPALVEGTVEQNLALPFRLLAHRSKTFDRQRACELLESLGKPPDFLAKTHAEVSGGEAQIAALVRVLLVEPAIILLDEPTASLDPGSVARVGKALSRFIDERPGERALVCASHDVGFLHDVATRSLLMREGTLTEEERVPA
jgi:putative ABC transport system ATP-binding protein